MYFGPTMQLAQQHTDEQRGETGSLVDIKWGTLSKILPAGRNLSGDSAEAPLDGSRVGNARCPVQDGVPDKRLILHRHAALRMHPHRHCADSQPQRRPADVYNHVPYRRIAVGKKSLQKLTA